MTPTGEIGRCLALVHDALFVKFLSCMIDGCSAKIAGLSRDSYFLQHKGGVKVFSLIA